MDEYVQADSRNLPRVDGIMILLYMSTSDDHSISDIRGAKALLSSREEYVDSAVGYVELRRTQTECFLRCKVKPDHIVSTKQYIVTATIRERDDEIIETSCDGCSAYGGGCKHTLVFLLWLNKRSEEPESRSVVCYWKEPNLPAVEPTPIESVNIFEGTKKIKLAPKDPNVLKNFLNECKKRNITNSLTTLYLEKRPSYNVFDMTVNFFSENLQLNENVDFVIYKAALDSVVEGAVEQINKDTVDHADSEIWDYIVQARITASKLYEASQCSKDGALVQEILGGYEIPKTAATKRRKRLLPLVLKEAEEKIGKTIEKSGFILIDSLVGASPDGIGDDFVIEVKCPVLKKALKRFLDNDNIKMKFYVQMQAQMLAANKKRGVLCIADPSFEQNNKIYLHWIEYDKDFMMVTISEALQFWEQFIFRKIVAGAINDKHYK